MAWPLRTSGCTLGLAGARVLGDQTAAGVRSLVGGGALGTVALVAIVFGAIASNAMNDYSASLALQAGGVRVRRNWGALPGTVLAFVLILWLHGGNTIGKFQNVLLFSAYWIAPFVAVVVIDWYARTRPLDGQALSGLLNFRTLAPGWAALGALILGFGAMVPFMNTGLLMGPVPRGSTGRTCLSMWVLSWPSACTWRCEGVRSQTHCIVEPA